MTHENQLADNLQVVENPELSFKQISKNLETSKSSVFRSLRNIKFRPYQLMKADFLKRQFCRTTITKLRKKKDSWGASCPQTKVLFTGMNLSIATNTDIIVPKMYKKCLLTIIDINVWSGIVDDYVVGLYFFRKKGYYNTYLIHQRFN